MIALALAWELVAANPTDLARSCDDLDLAALATALDARADVLEEMSGKMPVAIGGKRHAWRDYATGTLRPLAEAARDATTTDELCETLARDYLFYRDRRAGDGLFTVYYDPEVRGSRERTEVYRHPLYRRPDDPELAALTTEQILAGGLDDKGLELVWLDDATAANVAHVEGSAQVRFEDGSVLRLTVDGSNGHPYRNVGKLLVADDKIPADQVTPLGMTRARKYFLDHPDEFPRYWGMNPHYVFFKESEGPTGKLGPLTEGRSVAVDLGEVPLGAAVWVKSERPLVDTEKGEVSGWQRYARVAIAEDTGAAIRGPGRVDVFFGAGDYAAQAASVTARPGELYVILKRPPARAKPKRK